MPARLKVLTPAQLETADTKALVKHYLAVLEVRAPGRSVEVRVPPYAAVQVVPTTRCADLLTGVTLAIRRAVSQRHPGRAGGGLDTARRPAFARHASLATSVSTSYVATASSSALVTSASQRTSP